MRRISWMTRATREHPSERVVVDLSDEEFQLLGRLTKRYRETPPSPERVAAWNECHTFIEAKIHLDARLVSESNGPLLSDVDAARIGKHQRPGDAAVTQITAAASVHDITGPARRKVLDHIRSSGERGATDEEMQESLGMNPSTQRPRRVELVEGGWVVDSGRRRATRAKREAVVWVLTDAGRASA